MARRRTDGIPASVADGTETAAPPNLPEGYLWLFEFPPRLTRLQNTLLKQLTPPMTFRQFRLLRRVAEGHHTLTAIAEQGTLSLPTISESLETLVRKGLLRRVPQPHDRRSSRLEMTAEGQRVLNECHALWGTVADELLADLSKQRRRELRRDLDLVGARVARMLRERRGEQAPE